MNTASFPSLRHRVASAARCPLLSQRHGSPGPRSRRMGHSVGGTCANPWIRLPRAFMDGRYPLFQASADRPLSVRAWSEPAFCVCAQAPVGFRFHLAGRGRFSEVSHATNKTIQEK